MISRVLRQCTKSSVKMIYSATFLSPHKTGCRVNGYIDKAFSLFFVTIQPPPNQLANIDFDVIGTSDSVLHQLDQKIIYPHYDFKHLTEKYFEIGMKLNDFSIKLVK